MNMVGTSRDTVGEGIEFLQDHHGSFPVNQTTISLSADAYQDAVDRASTGIADVYVRVHNDDGEILHVEADDRFRVPRCVGDSEKALTDRAREAVREATGVRCAIDEVARVTIAGIRNADDMDADPVYRLLVLFEASHVGGTLGDATWRSEPEMPEFV